MPRPGTRSGTRSSSLVHSLGIGQSAPRSSVRALEEVRLSTGDGNSELSFSGETSHSALRGWPLAPCVNGVPVEQPPRAHTFEFEQQRLPPRVFSQPDVPLGMPVSDPYPPPPPPVGIGELYRHASSSRRGPPPHKPIFCALAFVANVCVFVYEVYANDWKFQPFSCPLTCPDGRPCNDDLTPCEANPLLGPSTATLDRLGAKNDKAIFERGEWWRVFVCNWMHGGVIHLLFNMVAVWRIGSDLERAFGSMRVAVLYLFAGIFGTTASVIFLPNLLSVGASGSVFGLVGACWADVLVNFVARGTLRNSGIFCLGVCTVLNLAIGFVPLVDNFMHLGGLVAGLVVGVALFAQKRTDRRTGVQRRTCGQELSVMLASLLLLVLIGVTAVSYLSPSLHDTFRQCPFCMSLNCIPTPWWSCCLAALRTRPTAGPCLLGVRG